MNECPRGSEIDELKQEVKDMKQELHEGELKFQRIEGTLVTVSEDLTQAVSKISEVLEQTQANSKTMFAVKWFVIGGLIFLVAAKTGLVDLVIGFLS